MSVSELCLSELWVSCVCVNKLCVCVGKLCVCVGKLRVSGVGYV